MAQSCRVSGVSMDARNRPRILLVDDEEMIASTLKVYLELRGFEVKTARNGLEALACVRQGSPDLIVLDTIMPHLDGWETLRRLRRQGITTPVLLLGPAGRTSLPPPGLHADDTLDKPFDAADLAARILALLHLSHPGP
jgi:DNA-binding response OmpR family regulator